MLSKAASNIVELELQRREKSILTAERRWHKSRWEMMRLLRTAALAALGQFLLCQAAGAQPLTKIRIGYPSISSRQAQLWVAKDEGLFRKNGLDVELIFLRG